MSRLIKFWSLSRREKRLLLEATICLLISNLTVKIIAFRHIESFLRAYYWRPHYDKRADAPVDQSSEISLINLSLSRAANQFPWQSLCLSRSIAAFIMFGRREIPVLMFVGVKFVENTSLRAHAWVHVGSLGSDESSENSTFTPLVTIS
jgi:hypothetical protein